MMRVTGRGLIRGRSGYSTIELLVGLLLGLVVLGSVYKVFFSQSRLYSVHRATMDVRQTLRSGAALISWELASAAPLVGDLQVIEPQSLTFRSLQGMGVVCSGTIVSGMRRFGLQHISGIFQGTPDDSALVFTGNDNSWHRVAVANVFNGADAWAAAPTGGGTPVCFWGDSTTAMPRPQATVELLGDVTTLDRVTVGAPIRTFRQTQYALFQRDGKWWLGRRVGSAEDFEIVTGPLLEPEENGVLFSYYDGDGQITSKPAEVSRVEMLFRGASSQPRSAGRPPVRDSLRTSVFLRGNSGS